MDCRICKAESNKIFSKKVLHKYDVDYFQCNACKFIQTEEPYWLDEAYKSPINSSDLGSVKRASFYGELVTAFFTSSGFDRHANYLDHGGGYGLFVRGMRDNGFNFRWSDQYCENIFATLFTAADAFGACKKYMAITAFEVMEHLVDPLTEIERLLKYTDNIVFSTELSDKANTADLSAWWYIGAPHGQHVSIFHTKTLATIAQKLGLNVLTNKGFHILSKDKHSAFKFKYTTNIKLARIYNTIFYPKSLVGEDYDYSMKFQ